MLLFLREQHRPHQAEKQGSTAGFQDLMTPWKTLTAAAVSASIALAGDLATAGVSRQSLQ